MQKLHSGDFMFRVRILDGSSRKLTPFLQKSLNRAAVEGRVDAALCAGRADLLIIPRGAALPTGEAARCLLTVGEVRPGAVSCGLASESVLTLSSIREDGALLTLCRELTTLTGRVLEPQEIPVRISEAAAPEPEAVAAAAGALLILGADAETGITV